jgi:membrane associated rhomboid family serine protease
MIDPASIALSAAALAQSSAAQQAASEAWCMVFMKGYQNDTASVEQARTYAACVYTVHGSGVPISSFELKIVIAVVIACMACVGWLSWRTDHDPLSAAMGCIGGMCGGCVLLVVGYGLFFIVS